MLNWLLHDTSAITHTTYYLLSPPSATHVLLGMFVTTQDVYGWPSLVSKNVRYKWQITIFIGLFR
jgi:hypothetical protein